MRRIALPFLIAFIIVGAGGAAHAAEAIFAGGFEAGTTCAWSASSIVSRPECSTNAILTALGSASTADANGIALRRALERASTIGSLADDTLATFLADIAGSVSSPVYAQYGLMNPKGALLTIGEVHGLVEEAGVTIDEALTALNAALPSAFAAPDDPANARLILMFSAAAPANPPILPVTADSHLSLIGTLVYPAWLAVAFPALAVRSSASLSDACDYTAANCLQDEKLWKDRAKTSVIGRYAVSIPVEFVASLLGTFATMQVQCSLGLLTAAEVQNIGTVQSLVQFVDSLVGPSAPDGCDPNQLPTVPTWVGQVLQAVQQYVPSESVQCVATVLNNAIATFVTGPFTKVNELRQWDCQINQDYAAGQTQCSSCTTPCHALDLDDHTGSFDCFLFEKCPPTITCEEQSSCVNKVTVSPSFATIGVNETLPMTATIYDVNDAACDPGTFQLTWQSDQPSKVEVLPPAQGPNATVKGKADGTATITATEAMSGKEGTATVKVGNPLAGMWVINFVRADAGFCPGVVTYDTVNVIRLYDNFTAKLCYGVGHFGLNCDGQRFDLDAWLAGSPSTSCYGYPGYYGPYSLDGSTFSADSYGVAPGWTVTGTFDGSNRIDGTFVCDPWNCIPPYPFTTVAPGYLVRFAP